jgi:hypothetical protein
VFVVRLSGLANISASTGLQRRFGLTFPSGLAAVRRATLARIVRWPLVLLVSLAGCGVADFHIDQPIQEQRIQGSPLPGPLGALFPIPINLDISAQIAAMETGPIDSITLSSLTLTITPTARPSGDTDDWSFLDKVDVLVSSTRSGSTLPQVKIATVSAPGAVTELRFTVEKGVDIKPYVDEGSEVTGQSSGTAPPDDVSYDGKAVFTVHPL